MLDAVQNDWVVQVQARAKRAQAALGEVEALQMAASLLLVLAEGVQDRNKASLPKLVPRNIQLLYLATIRDDGANALRRGHTLQLVEAYVQRGHGLVQPQDLCEADEATLGDVTAEEVQNAQDAIV